MTPFQIVALRIFFYASTGALFLCCLGDLARKIQIALFWQKTTGTITAVRPYKKDIPYGANLLDPYSSTAGMMVPTVEFYCDDIVLQHFEARPSTTFASGTVGRNIAVYYPTDQPSTALAYGFYNRWIGPLLGLVATSCIFMLISLCSDLNTH